MLRVSVAAETFSRGYTSGCSRSIRRLCTSLPSCCSLVPVCFPWNPGPTTEYAEEPIRWVVGSGMAPVGLTAPVCGPGRDAAAFRLQ